MVGVLGAYVGYSFGARKKGARTRATEQVEETET